MVDLLARAHVAWAAVGLGATLLLLVTGRGGHPPATIFLPHLLLAWTAGHGLIWGVQRLVARGRPAGPDADRPAWPMALRLTAGATGAAALVGVAQVGGTVLEGHWYPYHDARLWTAMLAVWLVHAACCAGLLLRRSWSRLLGAAIACGWAALLGVQIAGQLARGVSPGRTDLLLAGALLAALLAFGAYLASAGAVKSFLDD
jgi:hypothetical protein